MVVGDSDLPRSRIEMAESLAEVSGELRFGPTKTYQRRTIAVPGSLCDMLQAISTPMLTMTQMRSCSLRRREVLCATPTSATEYGSPAVSAVALPVNLRIHDLRHTCAALLISQGAHPKAIQVHLGHSSITVTLDRCGHLFPYDVDPLGQASTRRGARPRPKSPRPHRGLTAIKRWSTSRKGKRKGGLTSGSASGAGWTRTSDQRIMSPLL
jgi:hypothetical protein